jgi:putative Ca2+/H+ antiporter (TMEM165/GDT1 family)
MTMDSKMFFTVFGTVFLAELGDKTQLATLLFAAKGAGLWTVFFAAATALVLAAGLGVAAGAAISNVVSPKYLSYVAGIGFVAIGVWTLYQAGRMA